MCSFTAALISMALLRLNLSACELISVEYLDGLAERNLSPKNSGSRGVPKSLLQDAKHPFHRINPIMLCINPLHHHYSAEEYVSGPAGVPLHDCAWRLGEESDTEANVSVLHPPNTGRRWLAHDVFARDRQLFAIVPQYLRMAIRTEEIKPRVRATKHGSKWHELLVRQQSGAFLQDIFPHNSWDVLRWILPTDLTPGQFIHVVIKYEGNLHPMRVWHADMLGSQLNAQQALRRQSNEAVSIHRGVHGDAPVECITHPGWNCMWPRLQVRKHNSDASSITSGASLEPESEPHPNGETAIDPRPYSIMATTMMLLEDKERYMASWAAFHADRGVEAVVAYRNDDEWLQGVCLTVQAVQFYCEGIQLDDARQAPVDPSADFFPSSSKMVCSQPPELASPYSKWCLDTAYVSNRRNPTVLELSWPFRKVNSHADQYQRYRHEAQPHSMMHFLFKYGKPLAEWMINMDVDEYFNVTSFDRLIRKADANALKEGSVLPGSIHFQNRFAVASLKPAVASKFQQCPPVPLQLNAGAPMYQDIGYQSQAEMDRPFALAGLPKQSIPSVDAARLGDWSTVGDLVGRAASPLLVQLARHDAWWMVRQRPDKYWPLIVAPRTIMASGTSAFNQIRSKWMARTDLIEILAIHRVQLAAQPAPSVRQWDMFSRQLRGSNLKSVRLLDQLCTSGALLTGAASPIEEVRSLVQSLGGARQPSHLRAESIQQGAAMVHLMEQSYHPKLFQSVTASHLPDGEFTPSDCSTAIAAADGLGPLSHSTTLTGRCERAVRHALFLRGYCDGIIERYRDAGKFWMLAPFESPMKAEQVVWADVDIT